MPEIFKEALLAIVYIVGFWIIIAMLLQVVKAVLALPAVVDRAVYAVAGFVTVIYVVVFIINHVH